MRSLTAHVGGRPLDLWHTDQKTTSEPKPNGAEHLARRSAVHSKGAEMVYPTSGGAGNQDGIMAVTA